MNDLSYLLYSIPPTDSDKYPRGTMSHVSVHTCDIKQQSLFLPPWVPQAKSFKLSIFAGICGHLTAVWGGRCGLYFPGDSLFSKHSDRFSQPPLSLFLTPAIILVCYYLCFTFRGSFYGEMCFLQASLFYAFDLTCTKNMQ